MDEEAGVERHVSLGRGHGHGIGVATQTRLLFEQLHPVAAAQLELAEETAEANPDWQMDLCEEVIGGWRGEDHHIAAMTLVAAAELGRVGVTVNAIAPVAKNMRALPACRNCNSRPSKRPALARLSNVSGCPGLPGLVSTATRRAARWPACGRDRRGTRR